MDGCLKNKRKMKNKIFDFLTRNSDSDGNAPQNVVVNRTVEGTVFEVVASLAIVALWAAVVYMIVKSGGRPIPTHFDIAGNPDEYGSPYWLLLVGGVGTFIGGYYMLAAYHPTTWISMSFPVRTPRQIKHIVRWSRLMAVEVPLFCIVLTFSGFEMISPLLKVMIFIMMATCIGGGIMIKYAK